MRIKLLTFLGLLSAAIGLTLLFSTTPVHASGETYKWLDPNTIEASGGLYSNVNAANNSILDFPRKGTGNTFEKFSGGGLLGCDITMTITPSPDNTKGHLDTQGCTSDAKGFDRDFSIADPAKGPLPAGSTDNYQTIDCATAYKTPGDVARCTAIKSCVITQNLSATDCASAYATCTTNHTDAAGIKTCGDEVAAGNLALANQANTSSTGSNKTDCAVQGIGWIVCPVVSFMAKVVDAAYSFVSSLLTVQPLLTTVGTANCSTDPSACIYQGWSLMRNFANVAFVIVFLIIIFSQITSIGITNYGIKKMLPKLVVSAILVNVSYWICAIAIDVSNIVGTSITDIFTSLKLSLSIPNAGDFGASGNGWEGIAGGILAATAVAVTALYVGLSALIPMLLVALVAIVVTFLVLTLRQALIILLVIISPLIFVADLLPNTQPLSKKGRELFGTLLAMFPIISLIFGASAVASKIVMATATGPYKIAIQLMGAGISVIPLAITPIVMKASSGVLSKFGAFINNPNRGPIDRARKGAEGYRKNRKEYRDLKAMNGYRTLPGKGVAARRSAGREAILNNRKNELKRSNSEYVAGLAENNDSFRNKLAQGGATGANERALAQAINIQANLKADEVKASHATIMNANLDGDIESLQKLAMGGSVQYTDKNGQARTMTAAKGSALQTAAIQSQFKIGDVGKTDELVMNSASMGVEQRQAIADGMGSMSSKVNYYSGGAGNKVAQGQVGSEADLNGLVADALNGGKFSAATSADADKDALERQSKVAAGYLAKDSGGNMVAAPVSDTAKQALKEAADKALNDPMLKPSQRNQARLKSISTGTAFTGDADNKEAFKDMTPGP